MCSLGLILYVQALKSRSNETGLATIQEILANQTTIISPQSLTYNAGIFLNAYTHHNAQKYASII